MAITLHNIGALHQSVGEMERALEKYHDSLSISRAVEDRRLEANTLRHLGRVYWRLGETTKALERYDEALAINRATGDRAGEAAVMLGLARVEQKRGNLEQARQTIEQAIGIIESLRGNIGSPDLRASYLASQQEFYQSQTAHQRACAPMMGHKTPQRRRRR
jgi:tetratricopeptide (TPR) repeat protein